ncbi:MAG: hypothetical protein R3F46_04430 [bacterium]
MYKLTIAISVALLILTGVASAEHIYDGLEARSEHLEFAYRPDHVDPAEWSINSIQLHDSEDFPDVTELTDNEIKLLCGTRTSHVPSSGYAAWERELFFFVAEYIKTYGEAPTVFDYETAKQLPLYQNYPDWFADLWKNPITGEWTQLGSPDSSPGGTFVHILTEEEMQHFAVRKESYKKKFFLNSFADPFSESGRSYRVPEIPPVFIQIYGENGQPIYQRILIR